MRTIFVNPNPRRRKRRATKSKSRKRRTTKRRRARRRNPVARVRYRRRRPARRTRRIRRRRRRNVTPGSSIYRPASNPLILQNPRRRRRRRNPALLPKLTMRTFFNKTLSYGGGSAIGAGVNILALNRIEDMWFRNGARIGVAVLGGVFLRGELGAAMAGATMYPVFQEIALQFLAPETTEVDIESMAADLEEALNEVDELDLT